MHALTVDVEEYFQVSLFRESAPVAAWDRYPPRAATAVRRLLELFARKDARATFFVVGWLAEREPALIREIVSAGHEVASHGYEHREIFEMDRESFRSDLRRAQAVLEGITGLPVAGFRAPSWSITPRTSWALEVLVQEGYRWDSSVFPVHHDRYGWPGRPREPHVVRAGGGSLLEVPPATARVLGMNVPVAGGGYLRHLPFALMRMGIASLDREGIPAVVYLHPWEIDPGQPRIDAPALSRIRHYRNLDKVFPRLSRLLDTWRFGTIGEVLAAWSPRKARLATSIAGEPDAA